MSRPSRNGEFADAASRIGRTWRSRSVTAPPVGAAHPDVDVEAPGVVALDHPAQLVAQAVVVLGVDDPLVEVVRPRVGAGRGERGIVLGGQGEQPATALALALGGLGEGLPPPGPDLDLGVDQLAAHRGGELVVGLRGVSQLLEAVLELQRLGVEDRELLLDPDREVGGCVERLADAVEVEPGVRRLGIG